jgi:hypothetical protein
MPGTFMASLIINLDVEVGVPRAGIRRDSIQVLFRVRLEEWRRGLAVAPIMSIACVNAVRLAAR